MSELYRPEPSHPKSLKPVGRSSPEKSAAWLRDGTDLVVEDSYRSGAEILHQLRALMPVDPRASYETRQRQQRVLRGASLRLHAPIRDRKLFLKDAEPLGFLEELYPGGRFLLPFPRVQELHHAWKLYIEGVHLAVLGHRLYPFYGTYVPTRTTHLELFATWLSKLEGPRTHAIDVGTGCGVLAYMLARAGFDKVTALDHNANAVESVRRELARTPAAIEPLHGDLLEGQEPTPLIVFNPPWLQGEIHEPFDSALHFQPGLFERFFEQAAQTLTPDGRVVILFSTILELLQPDVPHPLLTELDKGRFSLVQRMQRRVKPTDGRKTRERVEIWELRLS